MAVKMRLTRMGKKRSPYYRVVVVDGRAPRDGKYIELIGRYDPNQDPSLIEIDNEKAVDWLKKGAQPTETVAKLLEISGAMSHYKVKTGRIHVAAGSAPPPTPAPEPVSELPEPAEAANEVLGDSTPDEAPLASSEEE
jgi:small subunit ribosomal protein S16